MVKELITKVRFSNGLTIEFFLEKSPVSCNDMPQRTFAKISAIDNDGDTHHVMNYVGNDSTSTYNSAVSSALERVISFCNNIQHNFFVRNRRHIAYDVNIPDSVIAQKCKKAYFKAQEEKYKRDIEIAKNRLADIKEKKTATTIHFN